MKRKLSYNESIRSHLESIAKLDEMLGPGELLSGWYDDLYFPCQNDKELYNQGVWEQGQKEWRECFTQNELEALARFHQILDQVVDSLSEQSSELDDPIWKRVQVAAERALHEMGPKESPNK
ncbi:MAG: hypothetical protein KUF79_00855 [Candidatus Thiodiazotropha sp. (ex Ctena orbiculata)]|nr:hypothetical protein [Candidatus Thiodiazotropha taylori]